jgi:hypothetical protein
MTYFEIQNHHGEKVGSNVYFKLALARGVARRLAGKWRKSNDKRGSAIKIVCYDGTLYGAKVIEWINA